MRKRKRKVERKRKRELLGCDAQEGYSCENSQNDTTAQGMKPLGDVKKNNANVVLCVCVCVVWCVL